MKTILDLCGGTGSWSKHYKENGYNVVVATYPEWDVTNLEHQKLLVAMKPYGILAAPPCTMFSYCRSNAKTPRDLQEGMRTVIGCLNIIWECEYQYKLAFWAIENPYGHLKRFLGMPQLIFQPFEYGDPYTKRTCLWGLFNEPRKKPVAPLELPRNKAGNKDFVSCIQKFAHLKTIPDGYLEKTKYRKDQVMRSMTPDGFAKQFYLANK